MERKELDMVFRFMLAANRIKSLKRSGWVLSGIDEPEHVGDHSFGVALLSYIMAKNMGLDADKCMRMGLIHDVCEAVHGDIARRPTEALQGITNREKEAIEDRSMRRMLSVLSRKDRAHFAGLWRESIEMKTPESRVVRAADGMDLLLQLTEYSKRIGDAERLEEFLTTSKRKMSGDDFLYLYGKARRRILSSRRARRGR